MTHHWEKNKRPGVDDMVLLKSFEDNEIKKNLRERFMQDCIYTYIGPVLISVNPFKQLNIYTDKELEIYRDAAPYENAPHVYALTDDMYRNMLIDNDSHCVIISGESGAGKTVAAKFIMSYITKVSGGSSTVERLKEIILKSNPLLEAFGNAKTLRNNNSSRFGKYVEIQFNRGGEPIGGSIRNFLLEKSRVLGLNVGERNFHIFYQMIEGLKGKGNLANDLSIPENANYFYYLNQTGEFKVDGVNDVNDFKDTESALSVTGICQEDQYNIFCMISGILHLGNIDFIDNNGCQLRDRAYLDCPAFYLGINQNDLEQKLLHQNLRMDNIGMQAQSIMKSHNVEQAKYARDALAKAIYARLFDYLVQQINIAMQNPDKDTINIGILDIYGFEIFERNGFEQFCINFVNEKLQQIFIELTLRNEQEEYRKEGVKWRDIEFLDNKSICELFEGDGRGKVGMFSALDDVCKTLHAVTADSDSKFLGKMRELQFESSRHCQISSNNFIISHYAGKVNYTVEGFCERNRDVLNVDLIQLMQSSNVDLIRRLFPEDVSQHTKRPTTAGKKIRTQANNLVDALMKCTPHYIRCIKPNESKRARDFEDDRVIHQIKYLGLSENIRVRRAGFSYRREYEKFVQRYAILHQGVWVRWRRAGGGQMEARRDTEILLKDSQVDPNEYEMGRTKIFIRRPDSLFLLEEQRARKYDEYARKIQKWFRKYIGVRYYVKLRKEAADVLKGRKERRRASLNRKFLGDYIDVDKKPAILTFFEKRREKIGEKVLFALTVNKFDRRFKSVKRDLILTDKNLYLIGREKVKKGPKKGQICEVVKRKIPIQEIEAISCSCRQDDFFALHIKNEYGSLLECTLKTEFFTVLSKQLKEKYGMPLNLNINNSYSFAVKKEGFRGGGSRNVNVSRDTGDRQLVHMRRYENVANVSSVLKTSMKTLTILVPDGLPPGTQPSSTLERAAGNGHRHSKPAIQSFRPTAPTGMALQSNIVPKRSSGKAAPFFPREGAEVYASQAKTRVGQMDQSFLQRLPDRGDITVKLPNPNKNRALPKPPIGPKPVTRQPPPAKIAEALYSYTSTDVDEMSFNEGDRIEIISTDGDWWKGKSKDGKMKLIPKESSSTVEAKIRKYDEKRNVIESKYNLSKYRRRSLVLAERKRRIRKLSDDVRYHIINQLQLAIVKQHNYENIDLTAFKWFLLMNFGYTHSLVIERLYRAVENLGDGIVNIKSCLELFTILLNGGLEGKSRLAFYVYDISGKGYIRRQDIFYFVKGSLSWDINEVRSGGEKELSLIALRLLDKDNDGLVSWRDFIQSVEDNPLVLNLLAPILPSDFEISVFYYRSQNNYKNKKYLKRQDSLVLNQELRKNYLQ
ncbi:DgyrCDS11887 [Dimorphilus gyrociliatus]|uniref:DgyrCDS11887 n=1 Tax=Dimorphilus gyrociliatus TaxID=2664684 RepID=A0A7I8W4S6_9ANNE|nr:DgyrCDS11887 [Dimorphilus gyrociliatus]